MTHLVFRVVGERALCPLPVGSLAYGVANMWGLLACEVRQRMGYARCQD